MDLQKQPQQPQPPAAPAGTTPAEPAPAGIRASDADRDRFADVLREAVADGRLTAEEHAERIDLVYRAKTVGELEPLVRDLPGGAGAARHSVASSHAYGPDVPAGPADTMVAVFSSSTRRGRWRVAGRTNAFTLFGSIEIDLTESLFGQRLSVINATSIFGNVEIRVPENISLRGSGTGFFGNFEVVTLESADPEAPVVVVNGYSVFGNIEAKPRRGKLIANLHDQLRKHFGR
ncbi:DUF1707 SHOCT-like domain-containing protein [Streptomyces fulvorobeus]|uniref:Cell wall-active antibiotics response LiaF-like C-terminal domain-containing protein n=1 Tax=Streptomyces fulvorobeus TaxID=284028 RepID=A0A7J0C9F8_9ACTN|nr:DUF1707 domain-containing protein [Streptomyces fulvorobeus]NYE42700.1 hypothetical protein [Streptomyces fulvorobeus]GFM99111.1 hypothetical protein Sfulv_39220 [Streptomyces fulvorobeus]